MKRFRQRLARSNEKEPESDAGYSSEEEAELSAKPAHPKETFIPAKLGKMGSAKKWQAQSASKLFVQKLYEGPPKCRCCKNWVNYNPEGVDKAMERYRSDAAILARYAKSHNDLAEEPLTLYSITVQNETLKSIVRDVLDKYPGEDASVEKPTFQTPFRAFFHRWDLMKSRRDSCKTLEEKTAMKLLFDLLDRELHENIGRASDLSRNGNITFDLLWTVFPPGSIAFAMRERHKVGVVVVSCEYDGHYNRWGVGVCSLDHDGRGYGWRQSTAYIHGFDGVKCIAELPVVPREQEAEAGDVVQRLVKRGEKQVRILRSPYQSYNGVLIVELEEGDKEWFADGRIMVDPAQYRLYKSIFDFGTTSYPPGLRNTVFEGEGSGNEQLALSSKPEHHDPLRSYHGSSDHDTDTEPEEHAFYRYPHTGMQRLDLESDTIDGNATNGTARPRDPLSKHRWTERVFNVKAEAFCAPVLRGYCFQSKKWGLFEVDHITEIVWNDDAFDNLVISEGRKRLLQAMVTQQKMSKAKVDDVVRGKGQGLILLLSGAPGTGKTLTAESIADRLRMPLYTLDASQLGDTSEEIEAKLANVLRLAAGWDAVLLLDEADAFLEKRGNGIESVERNKRVAAFLRVLEDYKGVLILTTNRPLTFDEAFYSRIHLSLAYADLDQTARAKVWSNFLRPVTNKITEQDLEDVSTVKMNGRQIKNVVKLARLLAEDEAVELHRKHRDDVIAVMKETEAHLGRGGE